MSMDPTLALVLTAIISALIGWLAAYLRHLPLINHLRAENSKLETTIPLEKQRFEEKLALLETSKKQLTETFTALSSEALKQNSTEFIKLANENLHQHHINAQKNLESKEQGIQALINPIKIALEKTEQQIHSIEKERKEDFGSLKKHIETMTEAQQLLQSETRNLVQALRRPEVRGQWGEMTLKRLAELSGMVENCDFFEQEHNKSDEGGFRPDMIVRMPAGREIVVDVKTPLDAYLNAVDAKDDATKGHALTRHTQNVRNRIKELASKAYWEHFSNSPDFVVLFIPGEQFLSSALDQDPTLLEEALRQKVILATPMSFVALLRAVGYGWRQEALAENAEHIRELGEQLYKRLNTFTEHLSKAGKSLGSSVDHYNKAIGSFERQIKPSAQRFVEMGINTKKPIEPLEPIDKSPRSVAPS